MIDVNDFDGVVRALKTRTPNDFKAAHILHCQDGSYLCLDLNVQITHRVDLEQVLFDRLANLTRESILPAAEFSAWQRFANGTKEEFTRMDVGNMARGNLMIVIRKEQ